MLSLEDGVLVLLAAGRSTRFEGSGGKLAQPLLGEPLGLSVARALASLPFAGRIAVTGAPALRYDELGFDVIANPDPGRGLAGSLRLGIARAIERGAGSAVVALADMPCITAAHVGRLFAASGDAGSIVASSDGVRAMPPVLFGADRLGALLDLEGDVGARALIGAGCRVVAAPGELIDVDTVAELDALRLTLGDPAPA